MMMNNDLTHAEQDIWSNPESFAASFSLTPLEQNLEYSKRALQCLYWCTCTKSFRLYLFCLTHTMEHGPPKNPFAKWGDCLDVIHPPTKSSIR